MLQQRAKLRCRKKGVINIYGILPEHIHPHTLAIYGLISKPMRLQTGLEGLYPVSKCRIRVTDRTHSLSQIAYTLNKIRHIHAYKGQILRWCKLI